MIDQTDRPPVGSPRSAPSIRRIAIVVGVIAAAVVVAWLATADFTQLALLRARSTPELEKAVREDPQSPWPAYTLGIRYARAGRLSEATTLFERARQEAPESFDVRFALGKVYALTGHPEAARTELLKAAEKSPNNPDVYQYLGRVQRLAGDTDAAIQSERRATALNPRSAEAWYQLGVLYPAGSANEAEGRPALKKAAELEPDNGVYAFAYGQSLADAAQFADAIPYLRTAVKHLPNDPMAWFLLGLSLHRSGAAGSNEATDALKHALQLAPNDFRAHFELANIALEQGRYADALPELENAARLNPSRVEVWAGLRTAADRTGRRDLARQAQANFEILRRDHVEMEQLSHHLAQQPDDDHARIRLGQLLEKQGNLRSALLYYGLALQHNPSNTRAQALFDLLKQRMLKEQGQPPSASPQP